MKSSIYRHYNYAFKFVNRVHVPYPMYFGGSFPFGVIEQDLGDYVNDFGFETRRSNSSDDDWGTARAYRIRVSPEETQAATCIALSHETGLEVFLVAAGSFIGLEVAKFTLKKTLETIESAINKWWSSTKHEHWDPKRIPEGALVEKISVRTPHWELTIDGSFTASDREQVLDYIGRKLIPNETVEEFVVGIEDSMLAKKVVTQTRRVMRRIE